jgi:hypothetical protein
MRRRRLEGTQRQARRASIDRKRNAFGTWKTPPPGNKKAPPFDEAYTFEDATGNPCKATGSEPAPHTTEVTDHEFCS